jgi:chorismate dehydratase
MIRLGNIDYSNCYPIHAPLLERRPRLPWLAVRNGSPGELNDLLARGELDVAPCSSIEYASHSREYRVLGGLCIGSDGPVESIAVVSRLPLQGLDGAPVALTTASASARCLLRILLTRRLGIEPVWREFRQEQGDPLDDRDLSAALFIGDTALRRRARPGELRFDLGTEWSTWTGLPFVYALWQAREEIASSPSTAELHQLLLAARDDLPTRGPELATRAARRYGLPASRLRRYWSRIRYGLDERMVAGLQRFYSLAAELGQAPQVDGLRLLG